MLLILLMLVREDLGRTAIQCLGGRESNRDGEDAGRKMMWGVKLCTIPYLNHWERRSGSGVRQARWAADSYLANETKLHPTFLYPLHTFPFSWWVCETYSPLPLKSLYASLPHMGVISVQTSRYVICVLRSPDLMLSSILYILSRAYYMQRLCSTICSCKTTFILLT
jgi:hypothetical protein